MNEYINIKIKKEHIDHLLFGSCHGDEFMALREDIEKQVAYMIVSCIVLGEGQFIIHDPQCGGRACLHKPTQGKIYRIAGTETSDRLMAYFTGPKWNGWCSDGIDEETAAFIESVVPKFSVNRRLFGESCEAWVHGFFENKPAILIWENSD